MVSNRGKGFCFNFEWHGRSSNTEGTSAYSCIQSPSDFWVKKRWWRARGEPGRVSDKLLSLTRGEIVEEVSVGCDNEPCGQVWAACWRWSPCDTISLVRNVPSPENAKSSSVHFQIPLGPNSSLPSSPWEVVTCLAPAGIWLCHFVVKPGKLHSEVLPSLSSHGTFVSWAIFPFIIDFVYVSLSL